MALLPFSFLSLFSALPSLPSLLPFLSPPHRRFAGATLAAMKVLAGQHGDKAKSENDPFSRRRMGDAQQRRGGKIYAQKMPFSSAIAPSGSVNNFDGLKRA